MSRTDEGRRVRMGLVGVGSHMTENLVPALRTLPSVDLVSVSARRAESARRFADAYGIGHVAGSLDALIDRPDVEAVVAAGPPDLHERVLSAALSAGKPVFVEKPPASSVEALEQLLGSFSPAAAARTAVGFNFRFADSVLSTIEAVGGPEGVQAATIRLVTARPLEVLWGQRSVLESMLSAVSIHAIELMTYLFGVPERLEAVAAQLDASRRALSVVASFQDGRAATLHLGNYGNRMEFDVELIGRDAVAVCTNLSSSRVYRLGSADNGVVHSELSGLKGGYSRSGYARLMEGFADLVADASPSPTPLADSLAPMRVIEAITDRVEGTP